MTVMIYRMLQPDDLRNCSLVIQPVFAFDTTGSIRYY